MPGNGPALLGMPEINNLGVLTIIFETIIRQSASDDNANSGKGNCHYERAVQVGGRVPESRNTKSTQCR